MLYTSPFLLTTISVIGGGIIFLVFQRIKNILYPPSSQPGILTIPTEHRFPFLGTALEFIPKKFIKTLHEFPVKYGPLIDCTALGKRILLISDPAIIREILSKRPKIFRRPISPTASVVGAELGLVESHGALWARLRRGMVPFFNQSNIRLNFHVVTERVIELVDRMSEAEASSKVIDMKSEASRLTTNVISAIAFGMPDNHPISSYFFGEFLVDLKTIFVYQGLRRLFPFPSFLWRFSSGYQQELKAIDALKRWNDACFEVLAFKRNELRQQMASPSNKRRALIDSLLRKQDEKSPDALTDDEIVANMKHIYSAGSDSTGSSISWIPYIFVTHPSIQSKVREEMKTFMLKHNIKQLRDIVNVMDLDSTVTDFKYTNAVVKELLRLCGPVSSLGFCLEHGISSVGLSNGLVINAGDVVRTNHDAVHYFNEDIFPNPHAFNPERWLTHDQKQVQSMEENFLAFGYGPRICPGMILATQELVVSMACLGYTFDFKLTCLHEEVQRVLDLLAWPNKMPISVKRIHQ